MRDLAQYATWYQQRREAVDTCRRKKDREGLLAIEPLRNLPLAAGGASSQPTFIERLKKHYINRSTISVLTFQGSSIVRNWQLSDPPENSLATILPEKFDVILNELVRKAYLLPSLTVEGSLNACTEMRTKIAKLKTITAKAVIALESKRKNQKAKDKHFMQEASHLRFDLSRARSEYQELQTNLQVCKDKRLRSKRKITSIETLLEKTEQEHAKHEEIRRKAWIDTAFLIVAVAVAGPWGLLGGAVKNIASKDEDIVRAIPGASAIRGIDSICSVDLEEIQSSLSLEKNKKRKEQQKHDKLSDQIENTKNRIAQLKKEENINIQNQELIDLKITKIRKKFKLLNNIKLNIDVLLCDYDFLNFDVDRLTRYIKRNRLNQNLVDNFVQCVRKIQNSLRKAIS